MIDPQDHRQWAGPIATPSPEELADRYAVSQLVKVYALGVDLRDYDLVLSVFDPAAPVSGARGSAAAADYLPIVYGGAMVYAATQHNITNQHVTIDGDRALVWSYAICYHLEEPDNGREDLIVATQYRDQCERRADGWIIVARDAVMQWVRGPLPRSE
jgi:hypothetical protein